MTGRFAAVAALAGVLMLCACGGSKKEDKKEEAAIPVEIARARLGLIEAAYHGTATLEAEDEATVSAKTAGVIESISAEEGDHVRAGQVLARLETERLRYELARAKSALDQAQQNFERNKSVFQRNIVSREAYDKTRFDLQTAQAAYDVAELNLREAEIKAPIDGVVSQRYIKLGNQITVGAQAFRVTRMDRLQANIYVPERDIHKLAAKQQATLSVDAWPDRTFKGDILRINPVVDAASGTVKVTVAMNAGQGELKPGMFGRVEILYDRREKALLVPKDAIVSEDAAQSVFVIDKGRALRHPVKTGYSDAQNVEIVDGLKNGDQVVVTGQSNLKDDAKVEVVNAQTAATASGGPAPAPTATAAQSP